MTDMSGTAKARRIAAVLALSAGLATITPAQAQIRAAQTMPATVQLEVAPDPPLTFRIARPLSFGTVRIPNQVNPNTVCKYELDGPTARMTVSDHTTNPLLPAPRTVNGCEQTVRGSTGRIMLTCERSRRMYLTIGSRPATIANVTYTGPGEVALRSGDTPNTSGLRFTSFITTPCDATAPAEMSIDMGGTLEVRRDLTLPVGQVLEVAVIVINAMYL